MVNMLISIKNGHRYLPLQKAGMTALLAEVWGQSTLKTEADEIENKLDRLGSSINISAGDEEINVYVSSLKENLNATLEILKEVFFEPKFDDKEVELERKKLLDRIIQSQMSAPGLANDIYNSLLRSKEDIMAIKVIGTKESVEKITTDDLKKYYQQCLNSKWINVSVSGSISKVDVTKALSFLTAVKPGADRNYKEPSYPAIDKTRIYFSDKKGAAQSEIRIGYMALPFDATGEFYKSQIMNFSFAGAFNSRVNYLLREVKGWTYGTRGGFNGSKFTGAYTISGGFKANTTDSTVVEIMNELKKYREGGVTDEELTFTKNAMSQSDALKYESPSQKLFFIKRIMDYNLPRDYVSKQTQILNTIGKDEINQLAKKNLPADKMVIFILGDKESNFEKLKKLGYEVIELDNEGNVINR